MCIRVVVCLAIAVAALEPRAAHAACPITGCVGDPGDATYPTFTLRAARANAAGSATISTSGAPNGTFSGASELVTSYRSTVTVSGSARAQYTGLTAFTVTASIQTTCGRSKPTEYVNTSTPGITQATFTHGTTATVLLPSTVIDFGNNGCPNGGTVDQRTLYLNVTVTGGDGKSSSSSLRLRYAATVKVMTWNIQHGIDNFGVWQFPLMKDLLAAEQPDVVLLQEIDVFQNRSNCLDEPFQLSNDGRVPFPYHPFFLQFHRDLCNPFDWNTGLYGDAILSKYPVTSSQVYSLPYQDGGFGKAWVTIGDYSIRFYTTHQGPWISNGSPVPNGQAQSTTICHDHLYNEGLDWIMGGDFNAVAGRDPLTSYYEVQCPYELGILGRPVPSVWKPRDAWLAGGHGMTEGGGTKNGDRIDYIFLPGAYRVQEIHTVSPFQGHDYVSDHFPVSATIRLPSAF